MKFNAKFDIIDDSYSISFWIIPLPTAYASIDILVLQEIISTRTFVENCFLIFSVIQKQPGS